MAATEAHIQGIARFLVGFGTEEDEFWRDYHFDLCGTIEYDAQGVPTVVEPDENSGYSLGCLQLDFGQTTKAADPFVTAFDDWHEANPGSQALVSTHQFVVQAITFDGNHLRGRPDRALRRQDVEALSAFVLSPDGSDWVNTQIDNGLIGSDQQTTNIYSGQSTLVGIARQADATAAIINSDSAAKTDLIYAMVMKAYNQAPGYCTNDLLPFLDQDPSVADLIAWPNRFQGAFQEGVSAAAALSQMWSGLLTPGSNTPPPSWLLGLAAVMDAQGLANPCKTSATSGAYVAARQIFESSEYFPRFVRDLQAGRDYIPAALFDPATGAVRIEKQTGRVTQGVMVKNKVGYVWTTASNAYQTNDGASWTPIDISQINSKQTTFERLRSWVRDLLS